MRAGAEAKTLPRPYCPVTRSRAHHRRSWKANLGARTTCPRPCQSTGGDGCEEAAGCMAAGRTGYGGPPQTEGVGRPRVGEGCKAAGRTREGAAGHRVAVDLTNLRSSYGTRRY